jgi:hypothetical protein
MFAQEPQILRLNKFYAKHIKKEINILIPFRVPHYEYYRPMQLKQTNAMDSWQFGGHRYIGSKRTQTKSLKRNIDIQLTYQEFKKCIVMIICS